jgi:hypothetical protein
MSCGEKSFNINPQKSKWCSHDSFHYGHDWLNKKQRNHFSKIEKMEEKVISPAVQMETAQLQAIMNSGATLAQQEAMLSAMGIVRLNPAEEEQKLRTVLLAQGMAHEQVEQRVQQAGFHQEPVEPEEEEDEVPADAVQD